MLLGFGADPAALTQDGESVWDMAYRKGQAPHQELLRRYGLRPPPPSSPEPPADSDPV